MGAVSFKIVPKIIERREWEPLVFKARKTVSFYQKAVTVSSAILDHTGRIVEEFPCRGSFCEFCKKHQKTRGRNRHPSMPLNADHLTRARENGGMYIFTCRAGLVYWTSPLYCNGRLYGALLAGGVLGVTRQKAAETIRAASGDGLSLDHLMERLREIPEKTHDEIKALAHMLLVCAEQASKYTSSIPPGGSCKSEAGTRLGVFRPGPANPVYPFDKEKMLLAALRRGDGETGRRLLNEVVKEFFSGPDFAAVQHRAIELAIMLSRAAMGGSDADNADILAVNDRCITYIQEARGVEDISDILHYYLERIGGKIFSFKGLRHASALRKAERLIWENYTRKIGLKEIARASGLSAPYFSTIFKEEMGENLSAYLNRLRVNRAAAMLKETKLSLDNIAAACGFEDPSWFSKIFKFYTGMSPGKFREQGKREGPLNDRQEISFGA